MSQYQPMYDTFQRDTRERYVPSGRIGVAASASLPAGDIDFATGCLRPDHVHRHRTQGKQIESERLERKRVKQQKAFDREMQKKGLRISWLSAVIVCAALLFACLFTIDYQLSMLQSIQDQRNTVDTDMTACTDRKEALEDEFTAACSETNILYAAAQDLNMIPAEAAEAVYLVPVDTRPLLTAGQPVQNVAGDMTVQTTQIPAVASAGN